MNKIHNSAFSPAAYGALFGELLVEPRLVPLDAGRPNEAVHRQLETLDLTSAFAPQAIVDEEMARACLAGLWLYHDFLDQAHTLSQEIDTPTRDYWHALMHRREPDPENAKYWFRKVGNHPIFEPLHEAAATLAATEQGAEFLTRQSKWDAFAFVDLCTRALADGGCPALLCRRIQQREWQLLFDYSHRHAIACR